MSEDSYLQTSDDQPKDLTVKTAKKLRPIPPPLNLTSEEMGKVPVSMLKEFAIFATSPKSPLTQKHLPFRKRAHSIPVNLTKSEGGVVIPATVEEDCASPSPTASYSIPSSPSVITARHTPGALPLRSHELISSPDLSRVLDLSASSALLSPAPSSLGSREELVCNKLGPWGYPWPPPLWHCFQPGCRVKVAGCWRGVEEMPLLTGELVVERVTPGPLSLPLAQVTCLSGHTELVVELPLGHPLLTRDRGWVAVCPDSFSRRYGLKCLPLVMGDMLLSPSPCLPLPSPDICDRIKRFSFPTLEESPPSPAFLLSPPTTPTRKTQDGADKPKRPMNAFMLFAKRYRLELIQTNPGKDNRAISVILGEAWRLLPQEEKDKYIQGARDLSEEQKLLYPDCWKRKRSHSTS